ncbi:hypothetical protein PF008_g18881 [Phytophthora fragariae]|uniref:Uncharacterized protein n=1 Tax=Phytophthora fragariae TaxID=53985 RepID=A0A6G0R4A1_9STRA|nr:hypothetical protein PF008_g18881 [Phytophthora fragariae]
MCAFGSRVTDAFTARLVLGACTAELFVPAVAVTPVVAAPVVAAARCRARGRLPTAAKTFAVGVGALDSASATTFVVPGRYSTSKSNSCSVKAHQCSLPVKLALVINHLSAAWSVIIVNCLPYRYGLNNLIDHTTAKHSSSVIP